MVPKSEKNYSFEEAVELIVESVAPLGDEYQGILKKGLTVDRWVDRYENQNKRCGAYSTGCYDSHPFILMNYKGSLRDVMTLAHEAGHSLHSYLSNKNQPYAYSNYSIFVAEVASTFNEDLLFNYMLKNISSSVEKAYLLNQKIDDIRSTLFRQTMFAEFELLIHEMAEDGIPLTQDALKGLYKDLYVQYYGPDLHLDPEIEVEFLRIPHFYSSFYVYQYATGISAAQALSDNLEQGSNKALEKYLNFLSSGSSYFPVELLLNAGVNMNDPGTYKNLISRFDTLVDELKMLISNDKNAT